MPPFASSNAPARALVAPVNAPFSCPNSSLSISVPTTAAQSTTMYGAGARGDSVCSVRAIMSLPVPVSPSISTVASVGAIFSTIPKISRIAEDFPTISPSASFSLGRISMRSSNGVNLISVPPTPITEPARRYASLTSALSRNVPLVDFMSRTR